MKQKSEKLIPKKRVKPVSRWVALQRVRCGKPRCHCAGGATRHPAYYLFTRVNGKLIKRYVRKADALGLKLDITQSRASHRRSSETAYDSALHWRTLRDTVRSHELNTKSLKENPTDA